MRVNYQGQVSKGEYMQALKLNFPRLIVMKWLFGFILAILLFTLIVNIIRDPSLFQAFLPGMVFSLVLLTSPWWMIQLQASSYSQKGNIYHAPVHGVIDETGILIEGENVQAKTKWEAYTHYKKAPGMVLLYQGKNSLHIFTKVMFSETDWDLLAQVVNEKLKPSN